MWNDQLEHFTETRFAEDRQTCQSFLADATALLEQETEPAVRLNLQFFIAEVQTFIDGYEYGGFYFPVSYLEGAQVSLQLSNPVLLVYIDLRQITVSGGLPAVG